jgi:hypothetical protein
MFIELTEYLRCPNGHEDEYLVLATGAMAGRSIRYGTLGCPVCHEEFPIIKQIARFGDAPRRNPPDGPLPPVEDVQAVLGLESPGGYVCLVGSAGMLADGLARIMNSMHFVCVNPPKGMEPGKTRSLLEGTKGIPLRKGICRGVIIGGEFVEPGWMAEAARVVLKGQRVIVLQESAPATPGLEPMASGRGMWAGRKI